MNEENVEISNAKEEILELVEKCNYCGLCKESDPVFKALREEVLTPRALSILFSKGIFDRSIFDYPLSGNCKSSCPLKINIDDGVRKARKILNLRGKEHPALKKILEKINNLENPYL